MYASGGLGATWSLDNSTALDCFVIKIPMVILYKATTARGLGRVSVQLIEDLMA